VVEQWLHDIFVLAASPVLGFNMSLSAAFWAAQNFETELSQISAAIFNRGLGTTPDDQKSEDWAKLRNRLKKENRNKRNKLAHGSTVSPVPVMGNIPEAPPVWVPFYDDIGYKAFKLTPPHARGRARTFEEFTANDIAQMRRDFIGLQHKLRDYYHTHFPVQGG
jgi:hypothetical protein